ncbi:MAG TPA: hypothetical protein VFE53_10235 [Mucilaginibacter sp.]|jgi:hypothetical protein|nr:hypothetical protein [Mucilaginibacter sp.]
MKINIFPRLKTFFLLISFFSIALYCQAQDTTKAAKPAAKAGVKATAKPAAAKPAGFQSAAAIIDGFFKKYKTSADSAVDYLFGTNKYFSNPAGIAQLKAKLDSMRLSLGLYVGHELIVQKTASPSLILYSYLVKHEIQPVRFTFIFYRPHSDWVFYRFLFDDQMDLEMEDGAKISNKHP